MQWHHIAHCTQSRDHSVGDMESHVKPDGVKNMRLCRPFQYCDCLPCAVWDWKPLECCYLILSVMCVSLLFITFIEVLSVIHPYMLHYLPI